MSASYWLQIDAGGPEPYCMEPTVNVTYNLGPMLRAAGFPAWQALIGAPASEAAGVLNSVAQELHAAAERLIAEFTPENGWGDWEGAVRFIEEFREACANAPKATIGGSL